MTKKIFEETDGRGNWSPARTRALMALVAVITGLAIWLVPVDEQQAPPSLPAVPSSPETTESLPLPPGAITREELQLPPTPGGGIASITTGGDRARTFLYEMRAGGEDPDADAVFAEAERMQGDGNLEDAYLLYRYAARHGQSQAALTLGTQADPAYHAGAEGFLPEADASQANKWYSMAAAAGDETAARRLQDLHKQVQQDAVAGNEQARRLMLQWQ
jgi:TPR repeat protein